MRNLLNILCNTILFLKFTISLYMYIFWKAILLNNKSIITSYNIFYSELYNIVSRIKIHFP